MRNRSGRYELLSFASLSVRLHRRSVLVVSLGLLSLLALALYSLTLGDYGLSVEQSLRRLVGDGGPTDDFLGVYFVQSVRLPRVIAAVAVGCSLGVAGAIFQALSGNPLGSPDIVGLSTGSATGALVAIIVLGANPATTSAGALIGAHELSRGVAPRHHLRGRADRRPGVGDSHRGVCGRRACHGCARGTRRNRLLGRAARP